MDCFQPYHDVPAIQMDDCLSSGPYWASIEPHLEGFHSHGYYDSAHTWNMQQRLMSIQHSVEGYGRLSPLQIPDENLAQLGLQSPWDSRPDLYRHMRTLSPGCAFGVNSATDSSTSEEAFSPDVPRHYAALARVPSTNHNTYYSPPMGSSFTAGNGTWMPQTLYSNAPPSSSYAPSDHSACNLKELQYAHDEDVDTEEERPSAAENQRLLQPEEVAFEDEGVGRSIGDEDSLKDSEDDNDIEDEQQSSDVDSDYNPNQKCRPAGASHSSPRRTRSLQSNAYTSPILSSSSRVSKPAHANHRRASSNANANATPVKWLGDSPKTSQKGRSFQCTFSHYGCGAVFASKNEWKRHVGSQHLQLGYWRCDARICMPDTSSAAVRTGTRGYNDFNRKDLFTQHHRRMHLPWPGKYESATVAQKEAFERGMQGVRDRCWVTKRQKPQRSTCGIGGCGLVFEGETAWEDRMEHVGRHFERGEPGEVVEDESLTEWAVSEGVVRDLGARGKWLIGMEPLEVGGGATKPSRRGRRTAAPRGDGDL